MQRLGGEQRVKGVDPQCCGGDRAGGACERRKVGEIADSPITRAPQPIELARQAPTAGALPELGGEVTVSRGNNKAELLGDACGFEIEPVITERQSRRQWHGGPPFAPDRRRHHSTGALLSAFEAAGPEYFPAAIWK